MKSTVTRIFLILALLGVASKSSASNDHNWSHQQSDIPADEDVYFSNLDNGIRYVIIPNCLPANRVSLRMIVEAGSLMETEDQRGIAHFLEHMAFNGTRNFEGDEVIKYFQRLGMAFGADTNAHTGFDETVYKLELPNSEEEILDTGILLLRDYADGMLLLEEEIEKERGVILSEKLTRDSIEYRTFKAELDRTLGNSLISKRHPIGTEHSLKTMPKEEFVSFYETWYRPDRIVLVIVGDIAKKDVESLIKKHFSTIPKRDKKQPDPDLGFIDHNGIEAHYHPEPEATFTSITMQTVRADTKQPDNIDFRKRSLAIKVANMILNKRLEKIAMSGKYKFSKGMAYYNRWLDFVQKAGIEIRCDPSDWKNGLNVAEQEIRRALQFGFTPAEMREVTSMYKAAYQRKVEASSSRQSRSIADDFVKKFAKGKVFSHPKTNFRIATEILESMTPEDCLEGLNSVWSDEHRVLFLTGNVQLEDPEQSMLEVYNSSKNYPLDPPVDEVLQPFAYPILEEPVSIISEKSYDDLGIKQIILTNNVRVNFKKTDFEAGKVRIYARFGAGILDLPKDQNGLALVAQNIFIDGGLGEHSKEEIDRLMAGKTVDLNFVVEEDTFHISGYSASSDLRHALELLTAYFKDPGYREESFTMAKQMFDRLYLQLERTPDGVVADKVAAFLASNDYRFGFPPKESLNLRSVDEVRDWLTPHLQFGYLEVSFVGDFVEEDLKSYVQRTLGHLPIRDPYRPYYTNERQIMFPVGADPQKFDLQSKIPKALSQIYWPIPDLSDISRSRRLNVLASILMDRMREKVREEIGEAYNPTAKSKPSSTFKDYGYLYASVSCKPDQVEFLSSVLRDLAQDLADNGINEDELVRAKKPLLNGLEVWLKNNHYWLVKVLGTSQENPERLDWTRNIEKDIQSITIDQINELANEYLNKSSAVAVYVLPTSVD